MPDAAEIRRARELVRSSLTSWDMTDQVDALVLAVSELVTNAIKHGDGGIEVHLTAEEDTVRLAVVDSGGDPPARVETDPSPGLHGGWGLRLVAEVADTWGAASGPTHTRVWMERSVAPGGDDHHRL
jgi:anti-sigma regulatory factor (Ser/Thr protein kinase)